MLTEQAGGFSNESLQGRNHLNTALHHREGLAYADGSARALCRSTAGYCWLLKQFVILDSQLDGCIEIHPPRMKASSALLIEKIISGGQTGVDRAALDFAISNDIMHGGWCPTGRRAADGALDNRYQLIEAESSGYSQRTKLNVLNSDGTAIIYRSELAGGSLLTRKFAVRYAKPFLLLNLDEPLSSLRGHWRLWIESNAVRTLNIAGPSEERCPGVYKQVLLLLDELINAWGRWPD